MFNFDIYIDVKTYIDKNRLTPQVVVESEPISPTSSSIERPRSQSKAATQHETDYEDIELNNMRKTIAKRLLESKVKFQ